MKREEHEATILRRYKKCGNGGVIAKELGITNYRVYKCLRQAGIVPKKVGGKEKYSASKMIQMYRSGMSLAQIARSLGMCPSSVYERLKNNNCPLRTKSYALELAGNKSVRVHDEHKAIDLYQHGFSAKQVAIMWGTSKDAVLSLLHKHDIPRRDTRGSNNPNWKGGRVDLHTMIRHSARYKQWRDEVMAERDYTCEVTGQKGGKLNVHHIKPFSDLLSEYVAIHGSEVPNGIDQFYSDIEAFEPFWDKSNALLVTEEEHKRMHSHESN